MLQLHKIDRGTEYAEFLHAPKKRFTDFGKADLPTDSFCFGFLSGVFRVHSITTFQSCCTENKQTGSLSELIFK